MSRNRGIPTCKLWTVKFIKAGKVHHRTVVYAPNKMFAKWNAKEEAMLAWVAADKITASIVKEDKS